jgi:hypothetical protein
MCILIFSTTLSETLVIMRRTQRDMIINVLAYSYKVPIFLPYCNTTSNFSKYLANTHNIS